MSRPEREDDREATPDYTDPAVPGAAGDAERPEIDPADVEEAGDTRPPEEADPDAPDDDAWEGGTLTQPGPG